MFYLRKGESMKITKRQLKKIIKEELKIVKRENNRLNEARIQYSEDYGYVIFDPNEYNALTIGWSERDIRDLISQLEAAIQSGPEGLETFEGI